MKQVIRTMIVLLLSVSLAFSAAFPKGIISFKNGTQIRVKKVSIEDNFVFYKYGGEDRSNLLEDVEYIKAHGKIQRLAGNIVGGASVLFWGTIMIKIAIDPPDGMTDTGKRIYSIVAVSATTASYLGARLVGGIFDPMKKIYVTTEQPETAQ